jgi:hypothetical protein
MAGVSGLAVGVATAGGLLVYAGFTGTNPIEALRQVSGGAPKPVDSAGAADPAQSSYSAATAAYLTAAGGAAGTHPEIARAALAHSHEIYSQAKRWQAGYSDCSSFVGKSLKDCGITPPGASVTLSYRTWRQLRTISMGEIQAGDLLCGSGHIAIALSPTTAIGQQRSGVNVRTGSLADIMYGQPGWVPRRYIGGAGLGSGTAALGGGTVAA